MPGLCQPRGAWRIVSTLGGKGFYLVIQHNGHDFRDPDVVQAFLKGLAQDDAHART